MINHPSMKSENPYSSFSEDGMVDIFIGLGIFFAGFFLWAEMVWMIAILIPAFLPSFQSIRKRFLESRVGNLVSNTNQYVINQKITLYVSLIMGILVLIGFWVVFMFELASFPVIRQNILLVLGMIFVCLWIFAGAMLKIGRFLLYAALTLVVIVAAQLEIIPFWVTFVILGGVIAFAGLLVLTKFLKQYPHG